MLGHKRNGGGIPPPEVQFILDHVNADLITMDQETKLPVKAEYLRNRITGELRPTPVIYWFVKSEEEWDG